MSNIPDSYKRFSERNFQKHKDLLAESVKDLPLLDFKFENFENCGTIFSTDEAMCSKCGSNKNAHADIQVKVNPGNPNGRIITSVVYCSNCNSMFGWGFRVEPAIETAQVD